MCIATGTVRVEEVYICMATGVCNSGRGMYTYLLLQEL